MTNDIDKDFSVEGRAAEQCEGICIYKFICAQFHKAKQVQISGLRVL